MKTNYHTHTYRCKHCLGSDEKMVQAAIASHTDIMGFSDHNPWGFYPEDYDSRVRMEHCYFPEYLSSFRRLREKYKDEIELHIGVEAEYYPHHMDWLREFTAGNRLEYVILGNHFPEPAPGELPETFYFGNDTSLPEHVEMLAESTIKGIETEFYSYVAHPDLFMRSYPVFDETCRKASHAICRAAEKHHAILEYNISGFWFAEAHHKNPCFPVPEFWRIASGYDVRAIIGYDAHDHQILRENARYEAAVRFLSSIGIKRVEVLPLFTY